MLVCLFVTGYRDTSAACYHKGEYEKAKMDIFKCVEIFYNPVRCYSSLGNIRKTKSDLP